MTPQEVQRRWRASWSGVPTPFHLLSCGPSGCIEKTRNGRKGQSGNWTTWTSRRRSGRWERRRCAVKPCTSAAGVRVSRNLSSAHLRLVVRLRQVVPELLAGVLLPIQRLHSLEVHLGLQDRDQFVHLVIESFIHNHTIRLRRKKEIAISRSGLSCEKSYV